MALVISKVNPEPPTDYMANDPSYDVKWVKGFLPKNRRGLAWLFQRPESADVNARDEFLKLPQSPDKRQFKSRFDSWLQWVKKDKWFHGWPNEKDYKDIFQFRYDPYRIMGFLCHPLPDDRRFQACVLVRLVEKHTKITDTALKKQMQKYADTLDMELLFAEIAEDTEEYNDERVEEDRDDEEKA